VLLSVVVSVSSLPLRPRRVGLGLGKLSSANGGV
jgi:hypothetical protein